MELAGLMKGDEWQKLDVTSYMDARRMEAAKEETLLHKRWQLVHRNNALVSVDVNARMKVVKTSFSGSARGYSSEALKLMKSNSVELQPSTKNKLVQMGLLRPNSPTINQSPPSSLSRVPPPLGKALVNLSSVKLTSDQESLLKKGPKFALGPSKSDGSLLAAHVEKAISGVLEPRRTLLRAKVVSMCQNSPYRSRKEWKVLRSIKQLDVVFLKADKAETIVLMDKVEFLSKVEVELRGGAYKELKKDPTMSTGRRIQVLTKAFTDPGLSTGRVTNPVAPRLFCQVKLHKVGRPLRLIVSGRCSPVSKLEKEVAKILCKYTKLNLSYIKNSEQLVSILNNIEPPGDDETLISLDIVQLFPNLPRVETIDAVNNALLKDEGVSMVLRQEVISAINFILENSFFKFGGKFYQQVKGFPIGSSLSPILAEIYLTEHERKARMSIVNWPRLFIRYVDDHLVLIKKERINEMVHQLNAICSDIQFTVENSEGGCIPFLDVYISSERGRFATKVFRKPTTSGILINNGSLHHPSHKFSTWSSMVNRAYALCNDEIALKMELQYLKELASLNGFQQQVVSRAASNYEKKQQRKDSITLLPDERFRADSLVILPYMGKISTKIGELLKATVNKKVAFQPLNKICDLIFNSKDPKTRTEKSGIYKVPCKCGAVYIGQTARSFEKRLKEHKAAVMNFKPGASAIARHFWSAGCDQGVLWEEGKVVIPDRNPGILKFREALEISLEQSDPNVALMNDQEQLGHLTLWQTLAGSYLFPTVVKKTMNVTTTSDDPENWPSKKLQKEDGMVTLSEATKEASSRSLRDLRPARRDQERGAMNRRVDYRPPQPRRGRTPSQGQV